MGSGRRVVVRGVGWVEHVRGGKEGLRYVMVYSGGLVCCCGSGSGCWCRLRCRGRRRGLSALLVASMTTEAQRSVTASMPVNSEGAVVTVEKVPTRQDGKAPAGEMDGDGEMDSSSAAVRRPVQYGTKTPLSTLISRANV